MYYKITDKARLMAGSKRDQTILCEDVEFIWHVPERYRSYGSQTLIDMAKSVAVESWTNAMRGRVAKEEKLRDKIDKTELEFGTRWNLWHNSDCRSRSWILRCTEMQGVRLTGENVPNYVGLGTHKPKDTSPTLVPPKLVVAQVGRGKTAAALQTIAALEAAQRRGDKVDTKITASPISEKDAKLGYSWPTDVQFEIKK